MSEPESLVAYHASVELELPSQPTPDLTAILADDRQRQSLRQELDSLGALYGRIHRDASLIKELEPITQIRPAKKVETVVYLIDVDVIRNLIDVNHGTVEQRRHAALTFDNASFRYAIPGGAFSELVRWLQGLISGGEIRRAIRFDHDIGLRETLMHLASALDISPKQSNVSVLVKEISSAVDQLHLSAKELLKFLSRPNFLGVYTDLDEPVKQDLKSLLESVPRRHGELRDNRDENDALNLAVVCKAERLKQGDHRLGSFVLLSQTTLILKLVYELQGDHAATLARALCKDKMSQAGYQVIRPEQAYCVEHLREDGRITGNSLHRVDVIAGTFRRLAHHFQDHPDGSFADLLPEVQRQHIRSIEDLLEQLARLSKDPLYRMIERERRIRASEPQPEPIEIQLELAYKTATDLSEKEKLVTKEKEERERGIAKAQFESTRPQLQSLFGLLTSLDRKLNEVSPTLYELEICDHLSSMAKTLKVVSHSPAEPVMDGELFLGKPAQGNGPLAYLLWWNTTCSVSQFLSTLEAIFSMAPDAWSKGNPASLHAILASEDEDEPLDGLLVLARSGAYRTSLQEALRLSLHGGNVIDQLSAAISKIDALPRQKIEIEAIRVQTPYGEFQLDTIGDRLGSRELSVMSRYDIGKHIASLCAATSLLGVFPERLYDGALKHVTGNFPLFAAEVEHAEHNVMRLP